MPKAVINDSLSLYYHIKGKGLPIVFIHPPVMGHKVFKYQERLAENYRLIFYDLPGHGQSSIGRKPLSIPLLAEELRELLDAIEVEKAVFCAFSHGALIAQEFALKYPERTAALILCGGYPEVKSMNLKSLAGSGMALAQLHQIPLIARVMAKTHKSTKSDEGELFDYAKKADAQKVYEYIKAGLGYRSTSFLHRLDMPVLLVYGSLEKMNHRYIKIFEKEIPNLQAVCIKGAPHQLPPKFFLEFNGIIHQFLQPLNRVFLLEETEKASE